MFHIKQVQKYVSCCWLSLSYPSQIHFRRSKKVITVLFKWSSRQSNNTPIRCCWHSSPCHYPSCSQHVCFGAGTWSNTCANPLESCIEPSAVERSHNRIRILIGFKGSSRFSKSIGLVIFGKHFSNGLFLCFELINVVIFEKAHAFEHPGSLN